jgi:O-antigen/teichoic acid export membrane protein
MKKGEVIAVSVATVLLLMGWLLPLQRYLTPKEGLGYALGWAGAIMMTLLFTYSIKRRYRWAWLEKTPSLSKWFNFHMVMGIYGPIAILYHCGYHLGATNSNMALWSMLVVFASGFVGKFLYQRTGWEIPFKWWHVAHLPFVGMLVLAAVIHIIASFYY